MNPNSPRDRGIRFSRLVAGENARRVLDDPAVLAKARAHLDRFTKDDPHQRHAYVLWSALLVQGADAVAAALRDPSPQGDHARETAPSFGGLPPAVRARLLRAARAQAAASDGAAQDAPVHEGLDPAPDQTAHRPTAGGDGA